MIPDFEGSDFGSPLYLTGPSKHGIRPFENLTKYCPKTECLDFRLSDGYSINFDNITPRFAPSERLKKFGREGTPEFEKNVKAQRNFVVTKLESLTNSFIQGIRDNLHCFPPSLARLLRNMYRYDLECDFDIFLSSRGGLEVERLTMFIQVDPLLWWIESRLRHGTT